MRREGPRAAANVPLGVKGFILKTGRDVWQVCGQNTQFMMNRSRSRVSVKLEFTLMSSSYVVAFARSDLIGLGKCKAAVWVSSKKNRRRESLSSSDLAPMQNEIACRLYASTLSVCWWDVVSGSEHIQRYASRECSSNRVESQGSFQGISLFPRRSNVEISPELQILKLVTYPYDCFSPGTGTMAR